MKCKHCLSEENFFVPLVNGSHYPEIRHYDTCPLLNSPYNVMAYKIHHSVTTKSIK